MEENTTKVESTDTIKNGKNNKSKKSPATAVICICALICLVILIIVFAGKGIIAKKELTGEEFKTKLQALGWNVRDYTTAIPVLTDRMSDELTTIYLADNVKKGQVYFYEYKSEVGAKEDYEQKSKSEIAAIGDEKNEDIHKDTKSGKNYDITHAYGVVNNAEKHKKVIRVGKTLIISTLNKDGQDEVNKALGY